MVCLIMIKKIKEICVLNKKIPNVIFFFYKINLFKFEHYDKMNKVEVVIMIVDPLSGGHNGNSEDHLPPSVKFLFK